MAGKIFINERREGTIAVAGRLHDRLAEAIDRDNLFKFFFELAVNDICYATLLRCAKRHSGLDGYCV
jgi:hypothetical protein